MSRNNSRALRHAMVPRTVIRKRRKRARGLALALALLLCAGVILGGFNIAMPQISKGRILTPAQAVEQDKFDCILVLGAKVNPNGTLSHMLEDRCRRGVELYHAGIAAGHLPVLLMSGDHGQVEYDEVSAMKRYAVAHGVPSSDVFMDHAGFSTYDSMYRARDVFQAERVLIVTQRYHLFRAVYIARQLGLDAWGVASDYRPYANQGQNSLREFLARPKDLLKCVIQPKAKYLGQPIPLIYDGNVTNDEGVEF